MMLKVASSTIAELYIPKNHCNKNHRNYGKNGIRDIICEQPDMNLR